MYPQPVSKSRSSASQGDITPQLSGLPAQSMQSAGLRPLWAQMLEKGRHTQAVTQAQTPIFTQARGHTQPRQTGYEPRMARQQDLQGLLLSITGWAVTTHKPQGSSPGQRTEEIQREFGFLRAHCGYQLILINTENHKGMGSYKWGLTLSTREMLFVLLASVTS